MSSAAASTPHTHISPRDGISPNNAAQTEATWSDNEDEDEDADDGTDSLLKRKRQRTARPISVSCDRCKERKVKCDRGQPRCGWCVRNNADCEYKERKKPGLRAGYGRELESRLGELLPSCTRTILADIVNLCIPPSVIALEAYSSP